MNWDTPWTVSDILTQIQSPVCDELLRPPYISTIFKPRDLRIALAVSSMRDHMTDEGWQIMEGLESAGYQLFGRGLPNPQNDLAQIIIYKPGVVVVQDKREWDTGGRDFRDPRAFFHNIAALRNDRSIFKATILKDAHQRPEYHAESAREMDAHAWIVYYNERIVKHVAPYVRTRDLVRVYHTVNTNHLNPYSPSGRHGCLLSGAVSNTYPLRRRLFAESNQLPDVMTLQHPGYHRDGCATPGFLRVLERFKVAICTASIYGYALRKIIEATAAGCIVITDLPEDDRLPVVDNNLIRIHPSTSTKQVAELLLTLYDDYDPERQQYMAEQAASFYCHHAAGTRLHSQLESMRGEF